MTKLHKLLFSAIGANDVVLVRDETVTDQAGAATSAEETIVVPVTVLEGDELKKNIKQIKYLYTLLMHQTSFF